MSRTKPGKRILRGLSRTLLVLVIMLVTGEVAIRILGYKPWNPEPRKVEVLEPEASFFQPHPAYGYAHRPGKFRLKLDDQLEFTARHGEDGYRKTGTALPLTKKSPDNPDSTRADDEGLSLSTGKPISNPAAFTIKSTAKARLDKQRSLLQQKNQIWVLGCSFTYGWGVEDDKAWPTQLQQAFPNYEVRNMGVAGYGTLQNWLQLKEELNPDFPPAMVILAYGDFHDQRNTAGRYWRKALAPQNVTQGLDIPAGRLDGDSLTVTMQPLKYSPWPGMGISAFLHFLEDKFNGFEHAGAKPEALTKALISKIRDHSLQHGTQFLLAGIYDTPGTKAVLKDKNWDLKEMGVVDMSVDLNDSSMRILPFDGHPNEKAHSQMAQKLITHLKEKKVLN